MTDELQDRAAKGGKARAALLSPEERRRIAVAAAEARWGGLPVARWPGVLKIGDVQILCAVLEDGTRVLTQAELLVALGRHRKANVRNVREENIPPVLQGERLKPFISQELLEKSQPIQFRTLQGVRASGYRAEILPEVCKVYLTARDANALLKQQQHIAVQADILIRGLAIVGIIAMVDAATGYEDVRRRDALAEILEKFVSRELRKWVSIFPPEFYRELYRLKVWDYSNMKPNSPKPLEVGRLTDDLVYKRLAPGVRDELRRLTPRNEKGYLKHKLHQRLTEDIGNPKLEKHLAVLVGIMQGHDNWDSFYRHVGRALPRWGSNLELPLND